MKPGGKESIYISKVLYNDKCHDLAIQYDNMSKKIFEGSICLVLPLYNDNLDSYVKSNNTLSISFSGIWISQILMGVSILHENNIIHNDIKEENIYIEEKGNLLIGNFGSSEIGENGQGKSLFTSLYVSPERAVKILDESEKPTDSGCDCISWVQVAGPISEA
eukprot:GHVR01075560.1.p1 GENE.GHVR01075560.1~~GHVR01075560.1.p1  ORF type:complete len:163 (+),score=26.63 GHVR01075560.1:183-671(+)